MKLSEAEELLPWAIAGTLSEDEARAVQAFIDSGEISPEIIAELEFLADTVQTVAEAEPKYNPAILKNVMSQLDQVPQAELAAPMQRAKQKPNLEKPGFIASVVDFLQWSTTPVWAKVTIAVQLSLLVGVIAIYSGTDNGVNDDGFQTAAGNIAGDFSVMFNPASSEADIRALLQQNNLTIVDGPSALGIYTLDAADNADLVAVQNLLQENPNVNYVQPVENQ